MPNEFPPMTPASLTLRDYFAAKAMAALCSHSMTKQQCENVPRHAYWIADEMLREREKVAQP